MKITYDINEKINHHEMRLVVHPKNLKLAKLMVGEFSETLGNIEVFDEYRNYYPIPLLSIYYIEMVDHKFFVYTEREVYRLNSSSLLALKERIKGFDFYQVNVRTLVNGKHVSQYQRQSGNRRRIWLDNGDMLMSSRQFKSEFDAMIEAKQPDEVKQKNKV